MHRTVKHIVSHSSNSSVNNHTYCVYSPFFNYLFKLLEYRAEVAETIRTATNVAPSVTFLCAAEWLQSQLKKPVDKGEGKNEIKIKCFIIRSYNCYSGSLLGNIMLMLS